VEIYFIKIMPDGEEKHLHELLNPEIPIPAEVSAMHGIYDKDVKDKPIFTDKAGMLKDFIGNSDFAGFNSNKFDFPMLVQEFHRAGIEFNINERKFVDAQRIFHAMEPRNLTAAYRFYCKKELENAHSAKADTIATWEIIQQQLEFYPQLENNVEALNKLSGQDNLVDLAGRIIRNEGGKEIFNFGKHRGKTVEEVLKKEPSYYEWMMKGDFPENTKRVMTELRLKTFGKS
jgi:DNA polymerase-3 subunit epsilon